MKQSRVYKSRAEPSQSLMSPSEKIKYAKMKKAKQHSSREGQKQRVRQDVLLLGRYINEYGSITRSIGRQLWKWSKYQWADRVNLLLSAYPDMYQKNYREHSIELINQSSKQDWECEL